MSNMLEQAIIDAESLREAALKSAESAVIAKYSSEVKTAMQQILEQDDEEAVEVEIDSDTEEGSALEVVPASHDPEIEDDEIVVIDLDQIIAAADADDDEEVEVDALDIADEIGIEPQGDATEPPANRSDEIEIKESDLVDLFREMMVVDVDREDIEHAEDLAAAEEEDYREEEVVDAALPRTDGMDKADVEVNESLKRRLQKSNKVNMELKNLLAQVKDRLVEVNLSNARLLYANRVLQDPSLNEQQKNKIVEMVHESRSVEEAQMVFETLQKTMASTPSRKSPQSLSEAVSRKSTVILGGRRETENADEAPVKDRWATLAGLNLK